MPTPEQIVSLWRRVIEGLAGRRLRALFIGNELYPAHGNLWPLTAVEPGC